MIRLPSLRVALSHDPVEIDAITTLYPLAEYFTDGTFRYRLSVRSFPGRRRHTKWKNLPRERDA